MEIAAYICLALVALVWLAFMIIGFIETFPAGIIGFVFIIGVGILFVKVLRDRLSNKEDDYYSRNIEK